MAGPPFAVAMWGRGIKKISKYIFTLTHDCFPQFQTTFHLSPSKEGRRGAGPDTAGRSDAPPETTTYEKKVGWLRAL